MRNSRTLLVASVCLCTIVSARVFEQSLKLKDDGLVPAVSRWISGVNNRLLRSPIQTSAVSKPQIVQSYGRLPLSFEANRGQTDFRVKFMARGRGYSLFLTATETVLSFAGAGASPFDSHAEYRQASAKEQEQGVATPRAKATPSAVLRMKLLGANAAARVKGLEELPGRSNYFMGNDPAKWRTNVPHYAKVKYERVYPGIDLVHYGSQQQLEYDFEVAPGTSPGVIRLCFDGAKGTEIDAHGDLILHTAAGEVREHKPIMYQEIAGERREVAGNFVLRGKNEVGFAVGKYNAGEPLIIDPTLSYSTYLGGSDWDEGYGIAVDTSGNAYVTGLTSSPDFPTVAGSFQTQIGGPFRTENAFVTKLNAAGTALVYSTYLGGSGAAAGYGVAVDAGGNAYLTGAAGANFPTTPGAFQTSNSGVSAFVTKLNPAGSALVYSTYLGDRGDYGQGIAVDASGNAFVTGYTYTPAGNFPTTPGAFQTAPGGAIDAFVTKLNPAGSALVFSTYLGGQGDDYGAGIAVDAGGNAYVTGWTESNNFPITPGSYQIVNFGGWDAFVTKLNAAGNALIYSTYLGGRDFDEGKAIAVDALGNAYVTGWTDSRDFPTTPGSFQPRMRFGGYRDVFVTKLSAPGSALIYSTGLRVEASSVTGNLVDEGYGIAVDTSGNAYVTGITSSSNFVITPGAFQGTFPGGFDFVAFVTKLNAAGSAVIYSSYLGARINNFATLVRGPGIAVDDSGNAYVTGSTSANDFLPKTPGAFQTVYGGDPHDAFVAKISPRADFVLSGSPTTVTIPAGQSTTYTLSVTPVDQFTGTVALSCAGAPVAANCSVSPASINITGPNAVTATLTVSTTARSLLRPERWRPTGPSGQRLEPWGIALVLLVTLAMLTKWTRQRANRVFVAAILLVLLCIACGGGGGGGHGTPPGTSTLTITGTSSGLSHSMTLTLMVN